MTTNLVFHVPFTAASGAYYPAGARALVDAATGAAAIAAGAASDQGALSLTALNSGPLAGFRNRLINGDFRINQRASAGGALAANAHGHDRWRAGPAGASLTVSAADPPVATLASGALVQVIEAANWRLAGQTVTVSVGGTSAQALSVTLSAADGGSGSVSGVIPAGSGRRGVSLAVPAGMNGGAMLSLSGNGAAFSEVMITPGGVVEAAFEFRPASIETALCRRYYRRGAAGVCGGTEGASAVHVAGGFDQPMRTAPTFSIVPDVSVIFRHMGGDVTATSPALVAPVVTASGFWTLITGFSGLTSQIPVTARFPNLEFLQFSAEMP